MDEHEFLVTVGTALRALAELKAEGAKLAPEWVANLLMEIVDCTTLHPQQLNSDEALRHLWLARMSSGEWEYKMKGRWL